MMSSMDFMILLIVAIFSCVQAEYDYSVSLEHSFAGGEFERRGDLLFTNMKGDNAMMAQDRSVTTDHLLHKLKEAADKDEMYTVRISSVIQSKSGDKVEGLPLITSVKASTLLESDGSHVIRLLIDGVGNIMAANILPKKTDVIYNKDDNSDEFDDNEFTFATLVRVSLPTPAAVPDSSGFLKKKEDERRKKEVAAKEAPTTFFGKYWMYIIPAVLFMSMAGGGQQ